VSRPTFRALAIFAVVSTMVPSGAAAQSAQPDGGDAGALAVRPPDWSELLDVPTAWHEAPQQVGLDRARGALWGGGIGLVGGALLGGLTAQSGDEGDGLGDTLAESAATGEAVVLGAVLGAGIGAVLGATVFAPSKPALSRAGGGLALSVHPAPFMLSVAARVRVAR
jgi:hypothetical protein